jgi:predicted GNAT family acetyltransferase
MTRHAVTHNASAHRFEAHVEGQLSVAEYRRDGARVVFTHTGVPAQQRGRGIAASLVESALDWARVEGVKVVPACSYVARYMQRHPQTLDLLAS